MYIKKTFSGYTYDGQQITHRQWFLILVQDQDKRVNGHGSIRAFVRKVAMQQCGHFMMGYAKVHGQSLIMSGSYGSDGLPKDVSHELYEKAFPLPDDLYDAWAKGEGWNSAGSEAQKMRAWAKENFASLAPKGAQF